MNWHDKKILVLGAGDTGLSVVRWAERVGARVRIVDSRDTPPTVALLQSRHPHVELVTGPWQRHDSLFRDAELIVASPGVAVHGPACDPAIARARAAGKAIVGDIELFAWQQKQLTRADKKAPHVIGITGSNGKSTVTAMVGAMCAAAGLKTVVAGNIGLPVLDALIAAEQGEVPDCYVLELSSFQLETTDSLELSAATMLNLSQDHLDRYASMADYANAKQRIFRHARHQVLNRDDVVSLAMRDPRLQVTTFGLDAPPTEEDVGVAQGALMAGREALMPLAEMPVAGLHNAANAGAAYALCRALGLPQAALIDGLKHFKGLPHRVENVGSVNGVVFFDDSKGTNVGSTVAALNGMTQPVILIAGGDGKQQDFTPLAGPIHERAKAVVLIGRDAALIERAVFAASTAKRPIHAASMMEAVEKAYSCASAGDAVLLSPACASFDMFKNYKHRGEVFARCVADLQARQGRAHV
ncbi:MAG: UDP-N-acetylmuramoyl-L-alanine--D-glutamate ligase [Betaproteobacteria bacterium]|nr:UDP-N-acetylmuramoyl-L-alanine--D-glutamate ligase [Betaproteobacteria bacterium]